MAGFSLAALACFAVGWLAYRVVSPEPGGAPSDATTAVATPPAPGSAGSTGKPSPPPQQPPDARLSSPPPARPALPPLSATQLALASPSCLAGDQPEIAAPADPSNYGERQARNWEGDAVPHTPALIVLHETVVDEPAALALFQRRQSDDLKQASYHVLIGRDGRRIRVVTDDKRAFGAGDSDFQGLAVQLRPAIPSSVNNIALHVSLVSPADGSDGERPSHAGYTAAQYASLARQIALWQALYGIPSSRVVTHQEVDRSGTRRDPRSFNWTLLAANLQRQLLACGAAPGRTASALAPGAGLPQGQVSPGGGGSRVPAAPSPLRRSTSPQP